MKSLSNLYANVIDEPCIEGIFKLSIKYMYIINSSQMSFVVLVIFLSNILTPYFHCKNHRSEYRRGICEWTWYGLCMDMVGFLWTCLVETWKS